MGRLLLDLQHATGEGGIGGWKIDACLTMPRIKMLAVKDMYWRKTDKGWSDADCPLGEGMCHYKEFLGRMVSLGGFHGPIPYCTLNMRSLAFPVGKGSHCQEGKLTM